jgi:hypothetical protein
MFAAWVAAGSLAAGIAAAAPQDLRFSEMFVSPVGAGGLQATARLRALEGERVRIAGYMVRRDLATPGSFVLAPVPVSIGDEDDGFADDLPPSAVFVHLPNARLASEVPYVAGIVRVSGTLRLGPVRESDGRISSMRLMLDEDAGEALTHSIANKGTR